MPAGDPDTSASDHATPGSAPGPLLGVGLVHPWHRGRIDHDAAIAYARATNDPNPAYERGEAVPPLYTASLILESLQSAVRASLECGGVTGSRGGVHGEHDLRFLAPVRPGMALAWRTDGRSAAQTPAGALVTQRITVFETDDAGRDERPVLEHLWSTLYIGGVIEADLGDPLPDHTFPAEARPRPLSTYTVDIDLDQGFRYAGVSGDRIGHSLDDEQARAEGFHGKILQGLCTLAMCTGGIVQQAAAGDPARLRRLAARFASPTYPKQPLVVTMFDAGRTDDGRTDDDARRVAFEAHAGGTAVVKHGLAEIAPG